MYTKVARLNELINRLSDSLTIVKTIRVDADQRMMGSLEVINVGDNSSVTIEQNQTVIMTDSERIIKEMKNIVKELETIIPNHNKMPLSIAVKNYKKAIVIKALEEEGGHQTNTAKRLGTNRTSIRYYLPKET